MPISHRLSAISDQPWSRVGAFARVACLAAALAVSVACGPTSEDSQPSPSPDARPTIARLRDFTGGVRVKVHGTVEWVVAVRDMALASGDRVETRTGGAAEIAYTDGLVLKVGQESLLVVEPTPSLQSGRFGFDSDRKTPEKPPSLKAPSFQWTDAPEAPEPPAGVVAVEPSGDGVVEQYRGKGRVDTGKGQRVDLDANERVGVDREGRAGAKVPLPPRPVLLAPSLGATLAYPDPQHALTVLRWRPVPGATSYHVMLDDDAWFTEPLLDRAGIVGASLELPGLGVGKYYWRVSAVDARKTEGAFSEFARFTVAAAAAGPDLVIESIEVRKNVAQISGRTEPGASVTVNGQKVDVREDGFFAEFVTLDALGRQTLVIRAERAGGAVTTEERSVLIESF